MIDHITPDWLPLLEQAAGLVIEQGGTTSHGAIVARELGIPGPSSVVADATQHLHNGDRLAIDGTSGEVCLLSSPSPATPPTSGLTLPLPRQ
ncbi:MAG: hypothetical protein HC838_05125 [Spirulinaceae cyanobacterium RM2_2_10]|nr:hypothetical protein [Spirulinaceae cyanobacterium RM2_2_10]